MHIELIDGKIYNDMTDFRQQVLMLTFGVKIFVTLLLVGLEIYT